MRDNSKSQNREAAIGESLTYPLIYPFRVTMRARITIELLTHA